MHCHREDSVLSEACGASILLRLPPNIVWIEGILAIDITAGSNLYLQVINI